VYRIPKIASLGKLVSNLISTIASTIGQGVILLGILPLILIRLQF
jgi:hypothetical protein